MSVLEKYQISYAQNREDVIVASFFPDVKDGTYVDVGANEPENDSVTKLFYDQGWRGLNIEPNRKLLAQLEKERPKDINVGVGISDKPGKIVFREYKNHGLSTFSQDMMEQYEGVHSEKTDDYEDYEVEVKTLKFVLESARVEHIHFIKIDVEGYEYEVLKGNDWKKFRPELICIESNHIIKDWRPLLLKEGYELIFNDGLNDYYLSPEAIHRAEFFDYPSVVLTGKQVISVHVANHLNFLDNERNNLEAKSRSLQSRIETLSLNELNFQEKIKELEGVIGYYENITIRAAFAKLLKSIYRSVRFRTINFIWGSTPQYQSTEEVAVLSAQTIATKGEALEAVASIADSDRRNSKLLFRRDKFRLFIYEALRTCLKIAKKIYHLLRRF